MNETGILDVKGLAVTLDGIQVLQNVSFTVKQGQALAVIGPNGAGKTVLFRALLGLLPYTGTVSWRAGAKIGYVPATVLASTVRLRSRSWSSFC